MADAAKYRKMADEMARRVNKSCWDGEWYTMAVDGWGTMLGSKKCKDGQVYLNTQTWAVIGDAAPPDAWVTRLYFNPLIPWMWAGAALMALGGALSLSDRRHRLGAPRKANPSVAHATPAAAEKA